MTEPLQILLVEDEVLIAIYLEGALQRAGYGRCTWVATGEEALALVQQDPPAVVIMDVRLAGELDGIQTAQQIRAERDIPLIFMTGYLDAKVRARADKLQPMGYCAKPINIAELTALLDMVLEQ